MICKHCNAENRDDAKFCSVCGQPLSGSLCPFCGTYNPDGAVFCRQCGARLDGKRCCAKCGAELGEHDAFCSQCGTKCEDPCAETPVKSEPWGIFRRGMHIAALAMSICVAAIAIIFTIFMGCNVSSVRLAIGNFQSSMPTVDRLHVNLFYYFGDAWEALDFLPADMIAYNATEYIKPILGLLICVATLTLVLIFAIMSIVRNVKAITKKRPSGFGTSLIALFSFIAGAVALFFLHSQSVSAKVFGESLTKDQLAMFESLTTTFSGATVAGFALGGVFLGLMIVFELLSRKRAQFNKKFIINASLSLGGAVLAIIMIAMFANATTVLTLKYTDSLRFSCGYGPYLLFGEGATYTAYEDLFYDGAMIMVLSAIAFALCCLALLLGTVYLTRSIRSILYEEQNKQQLVYCLVILIAAIASLILTVVTNNIYSSVLVDYFKISEELLSFSFVVPIVVVVMSALTLGVEIARKVIRNSLKNNGEEI